MEELESPDNLFENEKFYENAEAYWSQVPPTIDGMLGGFGCISSTDIRGSELFLKKLFNLKDRPGNGRALDCGAGIGRITKNLLVRHFQQVDLVEQNSKFVEAGKKFLMMERKVGEFYNCGLQNFNPKDNYYDVIWCQWVLGHLTDEHLIKFFINCKKGLRRNGIIVVKENVCNEGVVPDEEDSSVTRSVEGFLDVFKNSGLEIVRHSKQANFPKQLFSVKIFALRPKVIQETNRIGNPENVGSAISKSDENRENVKEEVAQNGLEKCKETNNLTEQLVSVIIEENKS